MDEIELSSWVHQGHAIPLLDESEGIGESNAEIKKSEQVHAKSVFKQGKMARNNRHVLQKRLRAQPVGPMPILDAAPVQERGEEPPVKKGRKSPLTDQQKIWLEAKLGAIWGKGYGQAPNAFCRELIAQGIREHVFADEPNLDSVRYFTKKWSLG